MNAFGILPGFKGVAVHDGWASCREYAGTHALCNAHPLRELIYQEETSGQAWPRKMIDFLCRAKDESETVRRAEHPLTHARLAHLRHPYDTIVAEGERDNPPSTRSEGRRGRVKQSPAVNLLTPGCAVTPTMSCASSLTRACLSTTTRPNAISVCRN